VTPVHGRELAAAVPGAQLVEIRDAGHLLATDAEEAVANAILSHLETVARANRAGD
jgi:pimeloyl-ACP methyl ester carboxylesterase